MIRGFLVLWFITSSVAFVLTYLATSKERVKVWKFWKRVAISAFIGMVIIIPLFLINEISGV